jgi:hypothetical protein
LTAEPVLLGLLVAPSWAGGALGVAAFTALVLRTSLKVVLVDRWRHRWLPRTRLAARIAAGESLLLVGLGAVALRLAGPAWLVPVALALPLVATELWFDMRSRSRRLVPEVCGAVGIAAVATSIGLAGGADERLAAGLWLVLAARVVGSIPFVRVQIARLRHVGSPVRSSDVAQAVSLLVAVAAMLTDRALLAGTLAVATLSLVQLVGVRRPAPPVKVLGVRQLVLGLVVVVITAVGV